MPKLARKYRHTNSIYETLQTYALLRWKLMKTSFKKLLSVINCTEQMYTNYCIKYDF